MKNKIGKIIIRRIIILVFLILIVFLCTPVPVMKIVEIKPGMSASQIATLLVKEKIIRNANAFLFFLRLTCRSKDLKAGTFKLAPGTNYYTLIKKLTGGSEVFVKVTVPEGFTAEQIARRLCENKIIDDEKKFIERVEELQMRGFLFPETYNFQPPESIDKILRIMNSQFYKIITDSYFKRAEELGYTIKEIVTLASLIEKEAKVPEERPVISAIFHKRLKKRMYLESCASVLFALGEHKNKLRYKDLEIDSPYNTYRNFGLPPTPICSPGMDSIKAALYPEDTDYLYFFARGDGSHIFTKTYEEHLKLQRAYKVRNKK